MTYTRLGVKAFDALYFMSIWKSKKLHIFPIEIKSCDCYNRAKLKRVLEMKVLGDVEAELITNENFLNMC